MKLKIEAEGTEVGWGRLRRMTARRIQRYLHSLPIACPGSFASAMKNTMENTTGSVGMNRMFLYLTIRLQNVNALHSNM